MDLTRNFEYSREDVVAALRLRFFHGSRLRMIAVIGFLSITSVIYNELIKEAAQRSWWTALAVTGLFTIIPLLYYWLAPILDYQFNRIWRQRIQIRITSDHLGVVVGDRPGEVTFSFDRLSRLLENKRVWLLYFGRDPDFFILPRQILQGEAQEQLLRGEINGHITRNKSQNT